MARTPVHPGEILADELKEIGLTAKKLADVIEVPPNRLYQTRTCSNASSGCRRKRGRRDQRKLSRKA